MNIWIIEEEDTKTLKLNFIDSRNIEIQKSKCFAYFGKISILNSINFYEK